MPNDEGEEIGVVPYGNTTDTETLAGDSAGGGARAQRRRLDRGSSAEQSADDLWLRELLWFDSDRFRTESVQPA
jgi:hypothetical protein